MHDPLAAAVAGPESTSRRLSVADADNTLSDDEERPSRGPSAEPAGLPRPSSAKKTKLRFRLPTGKAAGDDSDEDWNG